MAAEITCPNCGHPFPSPDAMWAHFRDVHEPHEPWPPDNGQTP